MAAMSTNLGLHHLLMLFFFMLFFFTCRSRDRAAAVNWLIYSE